MTIITPIELTDHVRVSEAAVSPEGWCNVAIRKENPDWRSACSWWVAYDPEVIAGAVVMQGNKFASELAASGYSHVSSTPVGELWAVST